MMNNQNIYDVVGSPGNDFFFFQGESQQFTSTLINPYSPQVEIEVDEVKNVGTSSYDGRGGDDILFFSSLGDVLILIDESGNQTISDVEIFIAGEGGDIIILANSDIEYGDVQIIGGAGDDVLWSNIGNDIIFGDNGNDHIHGGPGNDQLFGGNGDDTVFGGEGNEVVEGGTGNDILIGDNGLSLLNLDKTFTDDVFFPDLDEGTDISDLLPPGTDSLGVNADNLTFLTSGQVDITFQQGFAGYNNTLGMYRIAEDGTIEMASVMFANVKDAGIGNTYSFDLPLDDQGGQIGFFIIADGDRLNDYPDGIEDQGVLQFIYDFGGPDERPATIDDDGTMISVVYDDGVTIEVLNGHAYHTTARGGDVDINPDGVAHAVSGEGDTENQLLIGFEDLFGGGDNDFEDVFFSIDFQPNFVAAEGGNDTLVGGAGDDLFYGEGGDDLLIVGEGLDVIFGGEGSDTIEFTVADDSVDILGDFEVGADGDILDISAILDGYDPLSDVISDFVQLMDNADGDTEILINADGQGDDFVALALFDGGLAAEDQALFFTDNLVVI